MAATLELTDAVRANVNEGARSYLVPAASPEQQANGIALMLASLAEDGFVLTLPELLDALDDENRERLRHVLSLLTARRLKRGRRREQRYRLENRLWAHDIARRRGVSVEAVERDLESLEAIGPLKREGAQPRPSQCGGARRARPHRPAARRTQARGSPSSSDDSDPEHDHVVLLGRGGAS